jgi:ABC-type Fe3+ transport system permease subunit
MLREGPYALRGAAFRDALRRVGLDLEEGAEFLGISRRQAQRIAAGTHSASIAASKLLSLMCESRTFASEF